MNRLFRKKNANTWKKSLLSSKIIVHDALINLRGLVRCGG